MTPGGDVLLRADDQLLLAGRLRDRAALDTTMTEAFTASYVIDGRPGAVELGLAAVRARRLRRQACGGLPGWRGRPDGIRISGFPPENAMVRCKSTVREAQAVTG